MSGDTKGAIVPATRAGASALVGLACLLSACSGGVAGPTATPASPAPTTSPRPEVPAEPSAQLLRESRLYGDPAPLGAVQEEYGIAPVILDPGTYTFDDLGTTITLTLDDHWRLDHARPGNFLLTRPDAELAALLPAAVFVRPIGLATPGRAATESLFPGSHGWEPWALADWIEAMPQIVELDRGSFDADGRTVRWFDIDVDPELGRTRQNCEPGSCVTMAWTGDSSIMVARDLERIRWYEIEDPAGPMIIFVAGRDREFDGLVADVDAMVRSARVGESRPHPVPTGYAVAEIIDLMANTVWRFAGVDGLTFESETFTAVEQRPGAVSHLVWGLESTAGFVVPRFDHEGGPITSVDDIVAALDGHEWAVIQSEPDEIMGQPATVAEVRGESDGTGIFLLTEPRDGFDTADATWPHRPFARVWVVDSPLGPAMVVADGETEQAYEAALERVDFFTGAIGFCVPTDSCEGGR